MRCPRCNTDSDVKRSRTTVDGRKVTRLRECKGDAHHRFETVEQTAGYTLEVIRIRRSGDQRLAQEPFTKRRLVDDVRDSVGRRLSDGQIVEIVNAALTDVELDLPKLVHPLTEAEQAIYPRSLGAIMDFDFSNAVERHLRQSPSRIAHVLYGLAIRGRIDSSGRDGWKNASQVWRWLSEDENYPDLVTGDEPTALIERSEGEWIVPPPTLAPSSVVKRRTADRRHEEVVPFRLEDKFRAGIQLALLGRNWHRAERAVERWVLAGLVGQSIVTSAQLGAGVLDALRRLDDIAYLRWSIIHKHIDSVATFVAEVRGLIEYPSPRLIPMPYRPNQTTPLPAVLQIGSGGDSALR